MKKRKYTKPSMSVFQLQTISMVCASNYDNVRSVSGSEGFTYGGSNDENNFEDAR